MRFLLHKLIDLPKPGDIIVIGHSFWYGLKHGHPALVCPSLSSDKPEELMLVQRGGSTSTFWGPDIGPPMGDPATDIRCHMSVSGGPFATVTVGESLPHVEPMGHTLMKYWHWVKFPCENGGEVKVRRTRLWFAPVLLDNHTTKRMRQQAEKFKHYEGEPVDAMQFVPVPKD